MGSNTTLGVPASAGVLGNDVDPEGDPMAAVLVAGPSSGTLVFNSDGSFQYTPAAGFNGIVQFTYQTSDFHQLSTQSTVSIAVGLVADFDHNGVVDQLDYDTWRTNFGATGQVDGDGSGNGTVDAADFVLWRKNKPPAAGAAASSPIVESAPVAAVVPINQVAASTVPTIVQVKSVAQVLVSQVSAAPVAAALQVLTANATAMTAADVTVFFNRTEPVSAKPWDLNVLAQASVLETGVTINRLNSGISSTDIAFGELNLSSETPPLTDGRLPEVAFDPVLQNFWQSL
jgi:hypothetical protein